MNYYSLDGMDGIEAMFDPGTLKDTAIAVGVGALAHLATGKVIRYVGDMLPIEDADTKDYVQGGLAALIGLLGGAFLHQYNQPAAYALAGAMGGAGVAKMVSKAAALDGTYLPLAGGGLRAVTVELERALRGAGRLGAPIVSNATRENGLAYAIPRKFQSFMGA